MSPDTSRETHIESDYYTFMGFDSEAARDGLSYYVKYFDAGPVLELACGRGEFLELLTAAGVHARGVDLDDGMVAAARARGLDVATGDALEHLAGVPDGSLGGLFCAHFLEHLPAPDAERVYAEAGRVLRPGGVFVAAVPNAACLSVMGYDFWRDPTHVRFYDPMVMAFFAQRAGLTVIDQGPNPNNHAGPPPETRPIPLPDVPSLDAPMERAQELVRALVGDDSGDGAAGGRRLADAVRRRALRGSARQTQRDATVALGDLFRQLELRTQVTQHHLFALRGAYAQLLAALYPANEVFVAAQQPHPER